MIAKALGALALALIPFAPATSVSLTDNPSVVQVVCRNGHMVGKGTAFRISKDLLVSVAHVTGQGNCTINGKPIISRNDEGLDFSLIYLPGDEPSMVIDCNGFRPNRMVFASGFARGLPVREVTPLVGTNQKQALSDRSLPFAVLTGGQVIPGQSGGPIVNERGHVVGLVNAFHRWWPESYSRELKDTILCSHR